MTTEATSEKKTSRKRKSTEEVERKTNPGRAAKTKAEEAKVAASTSASTASTSKNKGAAKKAKTEKGDLPKPKAFVDNAKDLKVVITQPVETEEDRDPEDKDKEGEEEKATEKAETSKNGDSGAGEHLYTLEAKPQKFSTGSYGWSASIPKGKIKIHIDGNEVELPVTVNLNITVQGLKK